MPKYQVEHKISTLLKNSVHQEDTYDRFDFDGLQFSHWDFNPSDGCIGDSWIVSGVFDATDGITAANDARKKIQGIISRIAFIGQAYIEHYAQPFMVTRFDFEQPVALFYFAKEIKPVNLSFQEEEREILENLVTCSIVPEEFFFYWKDTVNTFGYSSKLLLMFSAIEALTKNLAKINKTKKFDEIEKILGKKLKEEIWKPIVGLRHRLVHGEYLQQKDKRDYIEEIHRKILVFFNNNILGKEKISLDVIHPQRHFLGNGEYWFGFIESVGDNTLDLKSVLSDFEANDINGLKKFNILYGDRVKDLKRVF